MSRKSYNPIEDFNTDWGKDVSNNLPYAGSVVQQFIKDQLQTAFRTAEFNGNKITFNPNTEYEFDLNLTGVYRVDLNCSETSTYFNILRSEETHIITIAPTTFKADIGSEVYVPVAENYTYKVDLDNGSGYKPLVEGGSILSGESASFDIRERLALGANRLRITLVGEESGNRTYVYTANLTTLLFTCTHTWEKVWHQGATYNVNNIKFSGVVEKTLKIYVDNVLVFSQLYGANTNYTTNSLTVPLDSSKFPNTTGVHVLKLQLEGDDIALPAVEFNIMCVESVAINTALCCFNNIAKTVVNFEDNVPLAYAVYNSTNIAIKASIIDENTSPETVSVIYNQTLNNLIEDTVYELPLNLEYETDNAEGISLKVEGSVGLDLIQKQQVVISVDNSNSYAATTGAWFHMKPALRSNSEEYYSDIINEVNKTSFPAVWTGFSLINNGWIIDENGVGCLKIPAGCHITCNTLKLLTNAAQGCAVEFTIKGDYPADYTTPILSITQTINNKEVGLKIYPNKIVVTPSSGENEVFQSTGLTENSINHIGISWQPNYDNSNANLCSIYINGIPNCNFDYSATVDNLFGNGSLSIGQNDTDVYIYKIRGYHRGLNSEDMYHNFLNAIVSGSGYARKTIKTNNNILDGDVISYEFVKALGYNCMVIEMTSGNLPSYENPSSGMCNMTFEYGDNSDWNVHITDIPVDGQGTTSKKYFRWNQRGKADDNTVWHYADGSTTTKSGWFDGKNNHPKIKKITAKKNYASSPQGHKMGGTALYDDLFVKLGFKGNDSGVPDANARVSVYQYPFIGFEKDSLTGTYTFIGLYTAGPDKGDNNTFGYDTDTYPNLLSLEGPDHNPKGTRFLHPWVDVEYDPTAKSLLMGEEAAWDVSVAGQYKTDKIEDKDNILRLLENEWKPAYNFIFNSSAYIIPLPITYNDDIEELNAAINSFISGTSTIIVNGQSITIANSLVQIYDSNYDVYGYDSKASVNKFVPTGINLLTDLYLAGTPSQEDIIIARANRFKRNLGTYFELSHTIFHYCFCDLIAASDNFAKNSYPFKFKDFVQGGRWSWRQDDLDTILPTDNNGTNTKEYNVEPGDITPSGVDYFQGFTSAIWFMIKNYFADEIKVMMNSIINAMSSIAVDKGISSGEIHNTIFNVFDYYFWSHSAKYFPILAYDYDRDWSYLVPWMKDPGASYNNVRPITQALGDELLTEKAFVEKRIAYIFSKYNLGEFNTNVSGYGTCSFAINSSVDDSNLELNLKPAIDLYPSIGIGQSLNRNTGRTQAGQVANISLAGIGNDTDIYIHGVDLLSEIGDLHSIAISSRGGGAINFGITSKRLKKLKVGDAEEEVNFNAVRLAITSESIKEIDARNVETINTEVDLRNCPRLRKALFEGCTNLPSIAITAGSLINELHLPENILDNLHLHTLVNLTTATLQNIYRPKALYINNCDNINPIDILINVLSNHEEADDGITLTHFELIFRNLLTVSNTNCMALIDLVNSIVEETVTYKKILYNPSTDSYTNTNDPADIIGSINAPEATITTADLDNINSVFPSLNVTAGVVNISFKDSNVKDVLLALTDTHDVKIFDPDDTGEISLEAAKNHIIPDATFENNTNIEYFNEYKYFKAASYLYNTFSGCTDLKEITLPEGFKYLIPHMFYNCTSLENIYISATIDAILKNAFENCDALEKIHYSTLEQVCNINWASDDHIGYGGKFTNNVFSGPTLYIDSAPISNIILPDSITELKRGVLNGLAITSIDTNNATSIGEYAFANSPISSVNLRNVVTIKKAAFSRCENIQSIINTENVITIEDSAFIYAGKYTNERFDVEFPNVTTIGDSAFRNCINYKITIDFTKVITIGNNSFLGSGLQGEVILNPIITTIPVFCFQSTKITKFVSSTVTRINTKGFGECTNLEIVDIGNENSTDVIIIDNDAFVAYDAIDYALTTFIIRNNRVASTNGYTRIIGNWRTYNPTLLACPTIYVHPDQVNNYLASYAWQPYWPYIESLENYNPTVEE